MKRKEKRELSTFVLFRKSFHYMRKYWYLIILVFLLAIAIAVLGVYTPLITAKILDDFLDAELLSQTEKMLKIRNQLMLFMGATILSLLLRYGMSILHNTVGMKIERDVRHDAMRKIDLLPVDYYSLEPDGKIVAKITNDTNGVRQLYNVIFNLVNAGVNLIIAYTGLILLEWRMALYMLVVLPILLLWITLYRRKIHDSSARIRELSSRLTGKLNEIISGALIIQAFNQEKLMLNEYKKMVNHYNDNDLQLNRVSSFFGWELILLIRRFIDAGILLFFGLLVLGEHGVVTAGLVYVYLNYIDKMVLPINIIFDNLNELEDSLVAANRLFLFLDEPNDLQVLTGEEAPLEIQGNIEFQHIKFAYTPEQVVLKDLSLSVKSGQTIGIVGHTGSGKSTLMNLLLRYNDYEIGELLLDGVDIRIYNKQSYRKHVGIVLQNPALFAGTLRSNVTLERSYSDEEVLHVLRAVGAEYLLYRNGEGLDTPVSFRGDNLSLGEKQLISFARILLRNPKILVLDEATANIDSDTEHKIKEAMKILTQDRTTFIIAHRLSTIKDADVIVVLHNGEIVGQGKHDELYETCSIYQDMYDSQFQILKNKF